MLLQIFFAAGTAASPGENADAKPLEIEAAPGQSLSQAIWLSGQMPPQPLCGGLGRCGRCRVRFAAKAPASLPAEADVFSASELAEGWRLACRRQVPDGERLALELPQESMAWPSGPEDVAATYVAHHRRHTPGSSLAYSPAGAWPDILAGCPAGGSTDTQADNAAGKPVPLALAVDLGTTSVYWRAVGISVDGERENTAGVVGQGSFLNPQAGAGADIMSRLAVARQPQGRSVLSRLVRRSLRNVVDFLEQKGAARVEGLCLAANTAMTDIFLDLPVDGLCAAPYRLAHGGHETVQVPGLPPVYIPPLPAPFVGGDVSAGLAALLAGDMPRPFVLADLGTNGELALVDAQGRLLLTSVPLGPALEGIGPQCGQLAGPGVITDFSLAPTGLEAHFFARRPEDDLREHGGHCPCPSCQAVRHKASASGLLGPAAEDGRARGISATGYVSLLAVLLRTKLVREDGGFESAPAMPLARRLAACLEPGKDSGGMRLRLPHGMWLCAADVEELLKVKAAFALALESLLAAAGLVPGDVAALCLAGALGEHVRAQDLETLGFLPSALAPRLRAVGNASLDGAALLVRNAQMRENLAALCATARLLPLVEEKNFHQNYLRHMRFGA
ncbi:ASKHA domain-containing protein [Desulfovibrio sp. 86]|uniref:Putative Iron-sulfur cluster-binding protein n=1 Tax=uncultured Desulfovibrio sp. TaxID=167968 RepID=A0A212L227_9BACT|nr:ASKHA domain-containing protein [Desulfovibrio sp. 86]SCM71603.1 putative Iron-sulfur cluster-binding protein [uncultured Desulfovibrio sp.]VZH32975.1 putative Iron-sulfur cluster-binding protein [Desulfovibrio sp. 86]